MAYSTIIAAIIKAANAAKVSSVLLVAICSYESQDFKKPFNPSDSGSPSYGICHVKEDTARMMGFKGDVKELMNVKVNAKYAARYLKHQETRYGESDWVRIVAAYNAGSFLESKKIPGCPRNLKYLRRVQNKLEEELKEKLNCKRE